VVDKDAALRYHAEGRPGKLKVVPTKPTATAADLSLAYSPGVAEPVLEIARDAEEAYRYTAKGNLVAVISNGTAILGLGNLGPLASKPVMEGKGVLFKRFADIDVFDIEIASTDSSEIIRTCQLLAPTFGGINLEDIRAPECFEIEKRLIETLDIPVFHDDQHGTAIISSAALLNALLIQDKKISDIRVVFSGAGASGIACARLYKDLGVPAENIVLCDTKGVIYSGRKDGMNAYKQEFAVPTKARTLEDALRGCDVFVGLSQAGAMTQDMVRSMAPKPIVFAMANPDPEITPDEVAQVRGDAIVATGRSDYPNQVNNVLGFPFIFRGALDVRASKINEPMKHAAVQALAELAQRGEGVPEVVRRAYPGEEFGFGPRNIIPKPFDPRVLLYVAPAVALAAMETGVARQPIDIPQYRERLVQRLGEISAL
jgi:malate dehydrogenase (oxaloacetate-decarboxylating)(NADP+)